MVEKRDYIVDKINNFIDEVIGEFNLEEIKYLFEELCKGSENLYNRAQESIDKSNLIGDYLISNNDRFHLVLDSELKDAGLKWNNDIRAIQKKGNREIPF